jgi:hypothetical protein
MLRDMITAAITRWRAPVAQPPAQPVNLAELHDPDFSGGLTPSQHLDVVHGGADPTWRPIETAPRDGTDFIAYNEFTGPYITAAKSISPIAAPPDGTIRFPMHYWHGQKGTWFPEPTHWQPLPSPPITPNPHA